MRNVFIVFIFIAVRSCNSYQLYDQISCDDTVRNITLTDYSAVLLNITYKMEFIDTIMCRFGFSLAQLKKTYTFIINLQSFELRAYSKSKPGATIYFYTESRTLFQLSIYEEANSMHDIYVSNLLDEYRFGWDNEYLFMGLKIINPSIVDFVLVITPGTLCHGNEFTNKMVCDQSYKGYKLCVDENYRCDGWRNCPSHESDESKALCESRFLNQIIIPSIVLSCTIFMVGWVIIKLIPCILEQRRIIFLRRNPNIFSSGGLPRLNDITTGNVIQDLQFPNRTSDLNLTPDNIPYSPPKYQNIYGQNQDDHTMPPSYSDEVEIGVVPEFFKRFYGKTKTTSTFYQDPKLQNFKINQKNALINKNKFKKMVFLTNSFSEFHNIPGDTTNAKSTIDQHDSIESISSNDQILINSPTDNLRHNNN